MCFVVVVVDDVCTNMINRELAIIRIIKKIQKLDTLKLEEALEKEANWLSFVQFNFHIMDVTKYF